MGCGAARESPQKKDLHTHMRTRTHIRTHDAALRVSCAVFASALVFAAVAAVAAAAASLESFALLVAGWPSSAAEAALALSIGFGSSARNQAEGLKNDAMDWSHPAPPRFPSCIRPTTRDRTIAMGQRKIERERAVCLCVCVLRARVVFGYFFVLAAGAALSKKGNGTLAR